MVVHLERLSERSLRSLQDQTLKSQHATGSQLYKWFEVWRSPSVSLPYWETRIWIALLEGSSFPCLVTLSPPPSCTPAWVAQDLGDRVLLWFRV